MKVINSVNNDEIKQIVKLHATKGRKEAKSFIAEGLRVCSTLIASNADLIQIYTTEKMQPYVSGFVKEDKITFVSEAVMQKISATETPSGILGVFRIPEKPNIESLEKGIVLAQISDPGNMGTLIRSSAALGLKSVVIIEGADPFGPKVVQASAGTIGQIKIFQISWQDLVKHKKELKLLSLVVKNGKNPKEIKNKNCLLIVGSEAHGIPQEWIEQTDEKITLPMSGNVESLNAAIAGSIAMYLIFSDN